MPNAQENKAPTPTSRRFALLGWPLSFSLSPAMHNAAFQQLGIDADYELLATPEHKLGEAVALLRTGLLAGANVTIPHKQAVLSHVDATTLEVSIVRAANTLMCVDGHITAYNTDVAGFGSALTELLPARSGPGRSVVVGAGGAARAIAHALLLRGWSVEILARRFGEAALAAGWLSTAHDTGHIVGSQLSDDLLVSASHDADLLVNATPVGAHSGIDRCLWPEQIPIPSHLAVMDVVAWPIETRLVQRAVRAGATAVGGLPMLVGQAAEAFELFTGHAAPVGVMRQAAVVAARGSETRYSGQPESDPELGDSVVPGARTHTEFDR